MKKVMMSILLIFSSASSARSNEIILPLTIPIGTIALLVPPSMAVMTDKLLVKSDPKSKVDKIFQCVAAACALVATSASLVAMNSSNQEEYVRSKSYIVTASACSMMTIVLHVAYRFINPVIDQSETLLQKETE